MICNKTLIACFYSHASTTECGGDKLILTHNSTDLPVRWTYSVSWERSAIRWAYRWDSYLMVTDSQIHWFSIINSLMVVLFLTGMIAIMMRTLHADFRRY